MRSVSMTKSSQHITPAQQADHMKWFLCTLLTVETLVAGAFYAIAAAILFADVILRELFNSPIWGGQRIAVLLANGAALIGIAVAMALNRHIRPSLLDRAIPARFERAADRRRSRYGGSLSLPRVSVRGSVGAAVGRRNSAPGRHRPRRVPRGAGSFQPLSARLRTRVLF